MRLGEDPRGRLPAPHPTGLPGGVSRGGEPAQSSQGSSTENILELLDRPAPEPPGTYSRRKGRVTGARGGARGSHTSRVGRPRNASFLALKRRGGHRRRVASSLREAIDAAAGPGATPADIAGSLQSVLKPEEWEALREKVRAEVRAEEAADATWLQWSQLGRAFGPLLLKTQGGLGECLLVAAGKERLP